MSAVSTSAINPDGVLASVGSRGVERNFSPLVAVRRVSGPCGLVPALLEAFRYLRNGEWRKSKREKSGLAQHVHDKRA